MNVKKKLEKERKKKKFIYVIIFGVCLFLFCFLLSILYIIYKSGDMNIAQKIFIIDSYY